MRQKRTGDPTFVHPSRAVEFIKGYGVLLLPIWVLFLLRMNLWCAIPERVEDLGLSDRDESKSVIEIRWNANPIQQEIIVRFNVILSVTYADGTTINEKRKIEREELSARIEVPSVRTYSGGAPAFIKKMDARVTAVISKN